MKKAILAVLVFSVFEAVAHAQNIPLADVSGGYSMLQVVNGSGLTAEGGIGSVALIQCAFAWAWFFTLEEGRFLIRCVSAS